MRGSWRHQDSGKVDTRGRLSQDIQKQVGGTAKGFESFRTQFFSLSQSMAFFVIVLVFWYGSRLVADLEYNALQFFICLIVYPFVLHDYSF